MSEEDIIEMIMEFLRDINTSEENFLSPETLREKARDLYTKIKLKEQEDRMQKGGRSS